MRRKQLLRRIYWLSGFLIFFVLAFLISVIFLNPSSVGNRNFLWNFNLWAFVWAAIFIVVVVLTFVLARNLVHLFFEFHAGHPGSRIKSKLVLTFIIFSLFPALIMFFVAFGLINQNLTKWVSAPSEQLLESSELIADRYYVLLERKLADTAARNAAELDRLELKEIAEKDPLQPVSGFSGVCITNPEGEAVFCTEGLEAGSFPKMSQEERRATPMVRLERSVNTPRGVVDRGFVRVDSRNGDRIYLFAVEEDTSLSFHTQRVREANEVYRGLKGTLASLREHYFLLLGMTTLTVVFAFVWLGNYIARRLTVPLEALAEGSRELASGNLDHRVGVDAVDELGILVKSFNQMAAQLKQSRTALEKANRELQKSNVQLDQRRRYIEAVLQNITTGVLTVDASEVIQTANQAALKMLQAKPQEIISRRMEDIADRELYMEFCELRKRAELFGTARKQVTIRRNGRRLYVAATFTTSSGPSGESPEYLIVLDDLTEVIRAEKFAAWQEVARRLAHEIKNPLTPIQLSAERVSRQFEKLAAALPAATPLEEFRKIVSNSTRMIISESRMLKNLLEEFSKFARLPICTPQAVNLHELIDKTLALYDGHSKAVEFQTIYDPAIETVPLDPEQIQRVFVNLLENSFDALVEVPEDRRITIETLLNERRGSVTVEIRDTGKGIPADDYEHLFLPYFSTKKKGTGLGLAIVRQIISEHEGFIRAEPNSPRGTRVILEVPMQPRGTQVV